MKIYAEKMPEHIKNFTAGKRYVLLDVVCPPRTCAINDDYGHAHYVEAPGGKDNIINWRVEQ